MGRAFEYRRAAKEKRWDKMSKLFPKLGKAITMAAKEGGDDPAMNGKLRTAIQNAKSENMPKDNIEAAIKRATQKDIASFSEIIYEGKGPHGVLVVVECATDNPTRTVANVKSYFNKAGGAVVPNGSLDFMFNRKSVFELIKTDELDTDELELALIDAGCEEIEVEEDKVFVYGDYTAFGTLAKALEDLSIEVQKSNLQRIPTSPIELSEEQMADVEKLLDKIEDDDDIQQVFTNIA
jgi:YebC/PmpR family DNA-binding regulatory protein